MGFTNWPYADFQDLNLDYILKNVRRAVDTANSAKEIAENLKAFVEEYFENLDVQTEINNKIDRMVLDGSFEDVLLNFVPAIIDTWLAAHITNPSSPPLDATLTLSNAAAQAKATGDKLTALRDSILPYGTYDVIADLWAASNGTHNNVTYTWNGKVCTVSSPGVASGASVNNIITPFQALPETLVPGKSYPFTYETTNQNIQLGFVFYDSNNNPTYINRSSSGTITIPANATAWTIRLFCAAGVNPNGTVRNITLLTGLPLSEVVERYIYGNKDQKKNTPAGLTYFRGITEYTSDNRMTPADMPPNSYLYSNGNRLSPEFMAADGSFFWVLCLQNMYAPLVRQYIVINRATGLVATGYTTDGGETSTWTGIGSRNSIKILQIGSSFGQDCCTYAPFIMEDMCPDAKVTFGIMYSSGATLEQCNTWVDDNTTMNYYKKIPGESAWRSGVQKTIKEALLDEDWDIILFNQSAAFAGTWARYSEVILPYIVKLAAYTSKPVKIGFLMAQKAIGYSYTYQDMLTCAQNVYNGLPVSFVIPAGAAIENARATTLDSVGTVGHLCADSAVGHLQEGLPCLIAGLVTASKLLEVSGLGMGGIYHSNINPTQAWVTAKNIPGQNGESTGLVGDNKLLGERCAIQAMKTDFSA